MNNRASVKPFLLPYIEDIGSQIGTDDISEIVSQIILDHKRGICRCGGHPAPTAVEPKHQVIESDESLLSELSELIP